MVSGKRRQPKKIKLHEGLADQPCWSFIKELNSVSDERLDSVAITDSYRQYSYRQMFFHWERYAEAFTGLGLTAENKSRVALITTPLAESIFAFYGLNMTGASISLIYHIDLYDEKQIYSMIRRENITDLVISELFAFPKLMMRLLRDKDSLGIRNIIILQSPMGGEYGMPPLEMIRVLNRELFREMSGGILMEDLLNEYEATPISYGDGTSPIILHTTGTVSGMHKPVPLTDKAMNSFVTSIMGVMDSDEDLKKAPEHKITYLPMYISWVYSMVDIVHTSLSLGMEMVALPMGATNPRYSEALEHYGINILFTSNSFLDTWFKTRPDIDLSELKIIFMGGTYVSPEFKKEVNDYLASCGSDARIINGYGLSEMGGACTLSPSSRNDDAIGYLLPGFKAKILVEDEERYYDLSDGPRTGVLLLNSPTMSSGKLDDTVFFELEEIDGEEYFNTHDLVKVNDDGSMTCIGRSNHYFVNNAGVRFNAGLIETAVTSQPGIRACGLAPEFHKTLHDNVPVLYVETTEKGLPSLAIVHKALIQVFIGDELISDTNLPSQLVLVDRIPLNSNGKVDAKKLATGTVKGERYSIKPVRVEKKLLDILLVPAAEGELATMGAGVPQELEGDPYNILSEVFAAIPTIKKEGLSSLLHIPGLRELILKLTDFDINNIPLSIWNSTPKLLNMAYKKYLMPLVKEVRNMDKEKKTEFGFMPLFGAPLIVPPMPFVPPMMPLPMPKAVKWECPKDKDEKSFDDWMDEFDANMKKFWDQMIDMQKSNIEKSKDQWEEFFKHLTEMQDSFVNALPEEMPMWPSYAPSPKEQAEQVKKYQEKSKEYIEEQADKYSDLIIKRQEQTRDMANTVIDKAADIRKEIAKQKEEKSDSPKKKESKAKGTKGAAKTKAPKSPRAKAPAKADKTEGPAEAPIEL